MLIEFTVANFRSIKDPVTLSFVARGRGQAPDLVSPDRMPEGTHVPREVVGRNYALLPVVAVFGPNASGKSNVLKALDLLFDMIRHGSTPPHGYSKKLVPFKLDHSTPHEPSWFEIKVALDADLFKYSIMADRNRIYKERLDHAPPRPKLSRRIFDRTYDPDTGIYKWENSPLFRDRIWREFQTVLGDGEPFINQFSRRLNVEPLSRFATWTMGCWPGISLGSERTDHFIGAHLSHERSEMQKRVVSLLRRFDTGVSDLEILVSEDEDEEELAYEVLVHHDVPNGRFDPWPIEEESLGTYRLFCLASRVVHGLQSGTVVLVDELGTNIHPNVTKAIVRLFQGEKTNPHGAQLIFNTHDNTLMRNLLRRDQIWFTRRKLDSSTDLYPLSDYQPRKDLAIDRAYLDGRFGAVPFVSSPEELVAGE